MKDQVAAITEGLKARGASLGDSAILVLCDMRAVFRVLLTLLLLLLTLALAVIAVSALAKWLRPPVQVTVTESNAVVIQPFSPSRTAMFLLSPNGGLDSPWVDTGIEIGQTDEFTVRATGRVCLSMHGMVDAANDDKLPIFPWSDPRGLVSATAFPPRDPQYRETLNPRCLVSHKAPMGRLIGVVAPMDEAPPHRPERILDIGAGKTFPRDSKRPQKGRLWLTVNDIWLGQTMEAAYMSGRRHTVAEWRRNVVDRRYWNMWYDDNVGSFLVTLEIRRP